MTSLFPRDIVSNTAACTALGRFKPSGGEVKRRSSAGDLIPKEEKSGNDIGLA